MDYARSENKLHCISLLFNLKVIKPQVSSFLSFLFLTQNYLLKYFTHTHKLIQHTTYLIEHTNLSENQNYNYNFGMQTHRYNNTQFRGHATREPVSAVYNDEQGDLFYSAGPHRSQS